MTIRCDTNEPIEIFWPENGGCDERAKLRVPGHNRWSYDFSILFPFKPGQEPVEIKVERKDFRDFAHTMFTTDERTGANRLDRQVGYVDMLVVEMSPEAVESVLARYSEKDVLSFQKRLARMSAPSGEFAKLWVVTTLGPAHTMGVLRYVEKGRATREGVA